MVGVGVACVLLDASAAIGLVGSLSLRWSVLV
jgi:hypothetical protein